jgi:hypothetical protein
MQKMEVFSQASKSHIGKTVFLSHSSKDHDYVADVIDLLAQFGATTYVDDGDKRLPITPSHATAEILKDAVKSCPRFIVLVSPNSYASKWIPWELGLADGYKGVPPVAIMPIAATSEEGNWAKQEYLGLYPRIVWRYGTDYSRIHEVYDPRCHKSWTLRSWLHDNIK